jgi:RNA-directed DNA polymerase
VDHEVLLAAIGRKIRDPLLLDLLEKVIASGAGVLADEATPHYFPGDDLFVVLRPTGLPIGNLTSQFFANVLLDPVDHFIKEELRVPGYVRYADDLVLFGDDKQFLWDCLERLKERLAEIRLKLHDDKTQIRPCTCSLKFLGFVLRRDGRRLQQSTLRRFSARVRRWRWLWKHGRGEPAAIRESLRATIAHATFANASGVLRDVFRRIRLSRHSKRTAATSGFSSSAPLAENSD